MSDASEDDRKFRTLLAEKVRDALGADVRQALFSAACLIAFSDLDLAERETSCIAALRAYLGSASEGARVTTRRQTRDQILATFRAAKLSPAAVVDVLSCLAYVAFADGVIKPEERELLDAIGVSLGKDAATVEKILERIAMG
jgi:tellurite resistance protein